MLSKVALSRVALANGHTDGKYCRETVTFLFIFILLHSALPGLFEMDSQALNIYYMYNIYTVCHYHRQCGSGSRSFRPLSCRFLMRDFVICCDFLIFNIASPCNAETVTIVQPQRFQGKKSICVRIYVYVYIYIYIYIYIHTHMCMRMYTRAQGREIEVLCVSFRSDSN